MPSALRYTETATVRALNLRPALTLGQFENICFGGDLKDWGFEPLAAQCYLGGAGICEAFRQGADIIICGVSIRNVQS